MILFIAVRNLSMQNALSWAWILGHRALARCAIAQCLIIDCQKAVFLMLQTTVALKIARALFKLSLYIKHPLIFDYTDNYHADCCELL